MEGMTSWQPGAGLPCRADHEAGWSRFCTFLEQQPVGHLYGEKLEEEYQSGRLWSPCRQLMCARDGISRLLNPDSPCATRCLSRRCSGSDNPGCQGHPASSATPGSVARSYIGTAIARCGRWPEPIHFCCPKTGSREQGPTLEFVHGHGSEPGGGTMFAGTECRVFEFSSEPASELSY